MESHHSKTPEPSEQGEHKHTNVFPTASSATALHGRRISRADVSESQTEGAAELMAARARGVRLSQRQKLFLLLHEPTSGMRSRYVGRIMWVVLMTYAFATVIETLRWVTDALGAMPFLVIRIIIEVLLSTDAFLRIGSYTPIESAHRDPYIWLNIITTIPFFLRFSLEPHTLAPSTYLLPEERSYALRLLEAIATFRLLKLTRYYEGARLLVKAVKIALQQYVLCLSPSVFAPHSKLHRRGAECHRSSHHSLHLLHPRL